MENSWGAKCHMRYGRFPKPFPSITSRKEEKAKTHPTITSISVRRLGIETSQPEWRQGGRDEGRVLVKAWPHDAINHVPAPTTLFPLMRHSLTLINVLSSVKAQFSRQAYLHSLSSCYDIFQVSVRIISDIRTLLLSYGLPQISIHLISLSLVSLWSLSLSLSLSLSQQQNTN